MRRNPIIIILFILLSFNRSASCLILEYSFIYISPEQPDIGDTVRIGTDLTFSNSGYLPLSWGSHSQGNQTNLYMDILSAGGGRMMLWSERYDFDQLIIEEAGDYSIILEIDLFRWERDENGDPIRGTWLGRDSLTYEFLVQPEHIEDTATDSPTEFTITSLHPNPFNSSINLNMLIPQQGEIHISIYDVQGRVVKSVELDNIHVGEFIWVWNGIDDYGKSASSGVYLCKVYYRTSPQYSVSKSITLNLLR